jgi:hypothetical protein
LGLDKVFQGFGLRRTKAKAKAKAINQSLRPLGFAPAFGRAEIGFADGFRRGAEAPLYLRGKSNCKNKGSAKAKAKAIVVRDESCTPTHAVVKLWHEWGTLFRAWVQEGKSRFLRCAVE